MRLRSVGMGLTLLTMVAASQVRQAQTPLAFWRDAVRTPLSRPDAEELFVMTYKDALLPPVPIPYLEGVVVSVGWAVPSGERVLLSMENNGVADAAIVFDGHWKLKGEPKKGTVVRFVGVAREFTRDPFVLTFSPDKVVGIDLESEAR